MHGRLQLIEDSRRVLRISCRLAPVRVDLGRRSHREPCLPWGRSVGRGLREYSEEGRTTSGVRTESEEVGGGAASTLSEDCHTRGVTPEDGDVVADPREGEGLIPETEIAWTTRVSSGEEAEGPQTIVDRYNDDVLRAEIPVTLPSSIPDLTCLQISRSP